MRQEKNNSSLQQRDIEWYKENKKEEYIEIEKTNKKKSLREMFEEEISDTNNKTK